MSESMERPPRPPLLDENDRPGPPPIMSEEPRRSSKGLTLFIAAFALVAFGGIVWYAYDQGRKTGSEETAPVIRADNAPVRVRPEKPGGLDVPHQDKLIFEKLTEGGGQTDGQVERLLPRPEAPTPPPRPAPEPETAAIPPAKAPVTVAPRPNPQPAPSTTTGTRSTGTGAPRSLLPPPPAVPPVVVPPAPKPETASKPAPTPAATPRPVAKPAPVPRVAAAPKPLAPPSNATSTSGAVQPVSGGRFRVQIAALRDEAAARAAWGRAQRANRGELGALTLTVERINVSGKGTFHRVQGGPLDEATARRICGVLDSRKQACIVVRR